MSHEELIRRLGETAGVDLVLSPTATAAVKFDDDEIAFESTGDRLYVYADLASSEGREDDFASLLEANHLCLATNGAAIGLDRERKMFTLCRVLEGETEYPFFEQAIAGFLETLRSLKTRLAGGLAISETDEPHPDSPGMISV